MQVFKRESIHSHCVGAEWPGFLGKVRLGESFIIETEQFNLAVLPEPTNHIREMVRTDPLERGWRRIVNDPRAKHCHQDCQYLTAGSRIHMKAQVDQAGLCAADVHAYIGQGEVAFAGIEVNADVQLRAERSERKTGSHLRIDLADLYGDLYSCIAIPSRFGKSPIRRKLPRLMALPSVSAR